MKKLLFILVFLLAHFAIFAQPAILEKGIKPKKGIYRSFQEFRNNSPSITINCQIQKTTKGHGFFNATLHETFKLMLKDPKALTKKDSVWGFSDGDSVYVSNNKVYKKRSYYDKLIYLGTYCIFETVETNFYPTMHMMPMAGGGMMPMGGGSSNRVLSTIVIDIRNGEMFDLTKSSLRETIQSDKELLAEFEDQKKKRSKLVAYLIEYCERQKKDKESKE